MQDRFLPLFILLVCFFTILSIPVVYSENLPDCELVTTSDATKINPGEKFQLSVFIVGSGDLEYGFLVANTDDYTFFERATFYDGNFTNPLNFSKNVNTFLFYPITPLYDILPETKDKIWASIGIDNSKIDVDVNTNASIKSGNHFITLTYVYQDKELNWHHASKVTTFYVNTLEEQYAIPFYIWVP